MKSKVPFRLWLLIALFLPLTTLAQESVELRWIPSSGGGWAFSEDGSLLAANDNRGNLYVWQTSRLQAGTLQPLTKIEAKGRPVGFARGGRLLLTHRGTQVELCDLKQGRVVKTLGLETGPMAVAISPDGRRIATGTATGGEAAVSIWSTQSGKRIRRFKEKSKRMIVSLAFSPDGKLLAAGGYNEFVRLWEVRSGTLRWEYSAKAILEEISFSPDGRSLVAVGIDAFVWPDIDAGQDAQILKEHNVSFHKAVFLPKKGLLGVSEGRQVRLWDTEKEEFVGTVGKAGSSRNRLAALAVSSDETRILTVYRNELTFWPVPSPDGSGD